MSNNNPFGDDSVPDPFQEVPTEISNERYTDDYDSPWSNDLGYSAVGDESSNHYYKGGNNKGGYSKLSEDDLRIREENLRRREEALLQRENMIENREIRVRTNESGGAKNWPSSCWAIAYHNIADDVPEEHQALVKKFYAALLFTWVCISWNWLTMIICVLGGESAHISADAIWSSLFVAFGLPGAWRFWYRNIYYGVGERSSSRWCMFGLFFSAHTVFSLVMVLGIEGTGAGGLFVMISVINGNKHQSTILLMLVSLVLWILVSAFSVHLLRKAHIVWKNAGQPQRLQQDLARTMVEQGMESGSV